MSEHQQKHKKLEDDFDIGNYMADLVERGGYMGSRG